MKIDTVVEESFQLGLFDEPATTAPEAPQPTASPKWFNTQVYAEHLPSELNGDPKAISLAILEGAHAATPPETGWVVNSSTGKDSSLTSALAIEWLIDRRARGLSLRTILIAISDTRSEFPEMALRMRTEAQDINNFAERENLPITAMVVQPALKARLLVEVLGNGKPLPMLANGKNLSAAQKSASWCMDRVKAKPLATITEKAKERFPTFVQMLGTRSQESSKRAGTMRTYSEEKGLPFGVTWMEGAHRVGLTPIVHWSDRDVTTWFKTEAAPWSLRSNRNLREIYGKASGDIENPTECSLTITKEGEVSNSCSDLTGTRMGCWMCMLSRNKSIMHTAEKDPRYRWLQKFHNYLYKHHARAEKHRRRRTESGFNQINLWRKTYLFRERYFMLMMIFRAEAESGFVLLEPDELKMIEEYWQKAGVWNIKTKDARRDSKAWQATGKPTMGFLVNAANDNYISDAFSEAIPAGAFWRPSPESGLKHGLELVHLAALAGEQVTTNVTPQLTSYVMRDRRKTDKYIVMVTDTPSVLGTKTNTGMLNGLLGAAWVCYGSRPPTNWEKEMADGRSFLYSTSVQIQEEQLEKLLKKPDRATYDAAERHYQNQSVMMERNPDWWEEAYLKGQDICSLKGKITLLQLERHYHRIGQLVWLSEYLQDTFRGLLKPLRKRVAQLGDLIEEKTPEGKTAQASLRALSKQLLAQPIEELRPLFMKYQRRLRIMSHALHQGNLNGALLEKLAYLVRMEAVDPIEFEREMGELKSKLALA